MIKKSIGLQYSIYIVYRYKERGRDRENEKQFYELIWIELCIFFRVINGEKQRIIIYELREWVWEIERLKERERERKNCVVNCCLLGQF